MASVEGEPYKAFRRDFQAIRQAIGRVVVGQDEVVEQALIALFCGGHVLLEGPPGVGKDLAGPHPGPDDRPDLRPRAIHAGLDAR